MVPQVGLEPTRQKAEDFESPKSTNSITVVFYKLEWDYTVIKLK